ncbi:MAG: hypothetical protein ACYDBB_02955 [Armatimonadota bacterium]
MAIQTQIIDRFRFLLEGLELRSGMYMPKSNNYWQTVALLTGFSQAESLYGHEEILAGFQYWLVAKTGAGANLCWWAIIHIVLAERDDVKAFPILVQCLREYIDETYGPAEPCENR